MTTTIKTGWWTLKARNAQTRYAYGTEAQANEWCDRLNQGRVVNQYAPEYLADDDDAAAMTNQTADNLRERGVDLDAELAGE